MRKLRISPEDRQRARAYGDFFGSSGALDQILKEQFPLLYRYWLTKETAKVERKLEQALEAIAATATDCIPTSRELLEASVDKKQRKRLRDRYITGMTAVYDKHFPRPGGRSTDLESIDEAVLQKARGSTWAAISKESGKYAEEDQARKAVARDRLKLLAGCLWFIDRCGPSSDAPPDVKDEFEKLSQTVYGCRSTPQR